MLLTAALLIAQLGIAMHPLHLDAKQSSQKVELTCSFCIAGSHLGTAFAAPVVHVEKLALTAVDPQVGNVCDILFFSSPRLTRGPPLSTTHV